MPASTPIYGFTYPCPGEAVSPAAIALLTGQIDTRMSDVDTDWFEMLNRRNINDSFGATQNITAGVETPLVTPTYVFPVAGVYFVFGDVFSLSTPATINSFRARLRLNGVARFGVTQNTENFITSAPRATVPMVAAAGDTASITVFYSGSATMNVQGRIAAKLVCRIA